MGLSPDPEKRARQLANLDLGHRINASRLDKPASDPSAPADADPDPEPAAGLEVVPYDPEPTPPTPPVRRPAKPRATPKPEPGPEPKPEPERRGGLSELWAGFTGG